MPLALESYNPSTKAVVLRVPSQYYYEYLEEHFVGLLSKVLNKVFGSGVKLLYRVAAVSNEGTDVCMKSEPAPEEIAVKKQTRGNMPPTILDAAAQQLDPQLNPDVR